LFLCIDASTEGLAMVTRRFAQVDVFTATAYVGNPLAVVLDGEGLDDHVMQRIANWTNLSETTFVLPPTNPQADYRVRIFTTDRELPFAGHPTLGTCHAWLEARGVPRSDDIVQECAVGLIQIRRDGNRLAFAAPPRRRDGPLDETELTIIARGLGLELDEIIHHAWCDNGPEWRGVMLASADRVLSLTPDAAILRPIGLGIGVVGAKVGVVGATGSADPDAPAFEVRAFIPGDAGVAEDPVTGSLNAALGQWLIGAGLAPERYVASQGTALGRAGRVHVSRDTFGQIWVGGDTVTCIHGTLAA
jgi:PhzF family phenazine biosynthesis protein